MMMFLGMLLMMMMMVTISEVEAQEGQEELSADYMESERVIEADAGKEAFNGMLAAVNTADERMKGFTGELEKAINKAVRTDRVNSNKFLEGLSYFLGREVEFLGDNQQPLSGTAHD